jgi:hypothetical protein
MCKAIKTKLRKNLKTLYLLPTMTYWSEIDRLDRCIILHFLFLIYDFEIIFDFN